MRYPTTVAKTKLNWNLDAKELEKNKKAIIEAFLNYTSEIDFEETEKTNQLQFEKVVKTKNYKLIAEESRTALLDPRYISAKPLVKLVPIQEREDWFGMDEGKGWIADDFNGRQLKEAE